MGNHYYAAYYGNKLLGLFPSETQAGGFAARWADHLDLPYAQFHTVKVWIGAEVKAVGTAQPLVP